MEKIFISIDSKKQNKSLSNLQLLSDALKNANDVLLRIIGNPLDTNIAKTLVFKGIDVFVGDFVKNFELQLKKENKPLLYIQNSCNDIKEPLLEDLKEAFEPIKNIPYKDYFKYIALHKNGNPLILENAQKDITEDCTIYADSEAKIQLHKKHLEAVKILNELSNAYYELFQRRLTMYDFYGTFLKFNDNGQLIPVEIPYNLSIENRN
ncbi:hypothetical protein [Pedobacter glucosidilyticus]|uniref:hypothetical protein n=1 Tax=Pedobacter glucosidilyticus TaxID=1122941 RepID=UPI00040DA4D4|nr:hypothetical protein [Pedobacter glucosidilyticus]